LFYFFLHASTLYYYTHWSLGFSFWVGGFFFYHLDGVPDVLIMGVLILILVSFRFISSFSNNASMAGPDPWLNRIALA